MASIAEESFGGNLLRNAWTNEHLKITASLEMLDMELQRATQIVDEFERLLSHVNSGVKSLGNDLSSIANLPTIELHLPEGQFFRDRELVEGVDNNLSDLQKIGPAAPDPTGLTRSVEQILKPLDSSIEIAASFSELPPKIKKLKSALEVVGDLGDGIDGIAGFFSGGNAGLTVSESLIGAIEGAAGAAEAGAVFGPLGVVVSLSALILGSIAEEALATGKTKDQNQYLDVNPSHWRKFFWDQEREKDGKKLLQYYVPNGGQLNFKQLDEIDKQLNSELFVDDRLKRVDKDLRETTIGAGELYNLPVYRKPSNTIRDLKKAFFPKYSVDQSTAAKIFDGRIGVLNPHGIATIGVGNSMIDKSEKRDKENKLLKPNKEPAWRLPTDDEWNRKTWQDLGLPKKPALKEKIEDGYEMSTHKRNAGVNNSGRVINIHLNKPMIENLVINVKDVKDGMTDFRQKVEEVLVEILNTATAIN